MKMSSDQKHISNAATHQPVSPAFVYAAISIALLLPVLFWPLTLWGEASLDPAMDVEKIWIAAGIVLLLSAVTADSVLSYRPQTLSPMFAAFWILLASLTVSIALRWEQGAYILAAVFALHSLRSGLKLWQGDQSWWLWAAWSRDSVAALSFFVWLSLIKHAG
ncbi:MAG: hypothetical protein R8L58_06630 [Mariprofundaceae bacterium]